MLLALSDPSSAEELPQAASRRIRLKELVVTPQKREQDPREVPLSLVVLDGEELRRGAIDDPHELAERVPGVRFTSNPCCTTVFVRGLGTPFATSAFEPAVGLAVDGLSLSRAVFMAEPLYDLERFEVLRGPQGTFFGRNTTAGLFNVTSARPTDEPSGYFSLGAGNLGLYRIEGAAAGPFGDVARLRLAGIVERAAGDVANTKLDVDDPGAENRAGRLMVELSPIRDLELLLIGSASISRSALHTQLDSLGPSSLDFLRRYDPRVEDDPFDHRRSSDLEERTKTKQYRLQANAGYALPASESRVDLVFGFAAFDVDQPLDLDDSPADILSLASPNELLDDELSVDLRFTAAVPLVVRLSPVDVLAGVYLFDSDLDSRSPLRAGRNFGDYLAFASGGDAAGTPPPGALAGDGARFLLDQSTRSAALYGHLSWEPIRHWTIGLGGRVTFERKRARLENECFTPGLVCAVLGIEEFRVARRGDDTDFSPMTSLQYAPFDWLALFAARTEGFKGSGFNRFSFTGDDLEVDPERAVSWEAGARGTLPARGFTYGATLFHSEVDDLQLQSISGGVVLVRNAASARSRGFELDLGWMGLDDRVHATLRGAFMDASFRRFPDAPAPASSGQSSQDLSGRRLPYAPKVDLAFLPGLRLPLSAAFVPWPAGTIPPPRWLTSAVDVVYRSRQFLDLDLDPATRQSGYTLLHFRVGLTSDDDAWSIGVAIENLTDTDALEFKTDSLTFPGGFRVIQEFGRRYTFGVRAAW